MGNQDAGRIEKRFEKPPEPKSTLKPLIFPIQEQVPPEKAGEIRFTLKELTIVGNTAFSRAELEPLYANLIGEEITLLDIYRIRDAITAKYGNAGFGLSKALIPEQRIQAEGLVAVRPPRAKPTQTDGVGCGRRASRCRPGSGGGSGRVLYYPLT